MINKIDFDAFMFFGHSIDALEDAKLFSNLEINPELRFISKDNSLKTAKKLWDLIIEEYLTKTHGEKIVVPLSGGLDSRLILAGLLKYINPKEINTYTFGHENSLDFKLGNNVAKKLGTNHISAPSHINDFDLDTELKWAEMIKSPTTLFYHPPMTIINTFSDYNYWYGFMGDPLAGSHLISNVSTFEEAIKLYFKKYGSISFKKAEDYKLNLDKVKSLINQSVDLNRNINIFENIDFTIRQQQYIKPHVVFSKNNVLPFIDQRWIDLMLNIPIHLRSNEVFYREFMMSSYPEIFKLPCKNNLGYKLGSKLSIIPKIKMKVSIKQREMLFNYIDFNNALKSNSKFSQFIKELILSNDGVGNFSKNQIEKIWQDFIKKEINFGFILNIASFVILNKDSK